jgi:phosphate transport system substrate-binding protein
VLKKQLWIYFMAGVILGGASLSLREALADVQQNNLAAVHKNSLIITGSSTMCPMIAETAKRFQSLHNGVHIDVQCGGSERGIRDVRSGTADIGMVSRAFNSSESDLFGFPIARDGISIIVHKDNPVKTLSDSQLMGIFTGRTARWEEIQGKSGPITVVLREPQKAATELLVSYLKIKAADLTGSISRGDIQVGLDAVAADRKAIGYISSGYAEHAIAKGVPIKILPVHNVMPTRRNILTSNYPIQRCLMLITAKLPEGIVKDFINFSLSSANVDIIESFDYVSYED